ncbi:MAG: hypothetical protein IKA11_03230 [Clostridia bacterium]|nr:hypothetical protein [Clostridia bacterium]
MTLEKLQKITASVTASAVLLLFILVAIMVYQMGIINGKRAKIEELKQEIALLEEQKQHTENDIEIWLSDWKLKERANELGYIYTTDK